MRTWGVAIKVISGDNPITVSETAKQAGIEGAENYVDAGTLKTEEDIALCGEQIYGLRKGNPGTEKTVCAGTEKAGNDGRYDR